MTPAGLEKAHCFKSSNIRGDGDRAKKNRRLTENHDKPQEERD